jgi:hypothetical protein
MMGDHVYHAGEVAAGRPQRVPPFLGGRAAPEKSGWSGSRPGAILVHPHQEITMRSTLLRSRLLLPALAGIALAACGESTASEPASLTSYGAPLPLGSGTARVYAQFANGAPAEVGVALSEAAFAGLPADGAAGGMPMPDGHHTYVSILQMPARNPTPYRFVALDWNPAGHMPPGIYDQPHFDFHFFSTTEAARGAIVPTDPEFDAKGERVPGAELLPAGYTKLPGAVPLMGAHWVDPTSPELNGQLFTRTFLYGTWDGELIFAEPMVTKAFLEAKPDFRAPIATPARYAAAGYYPTEYRVYWNAAAKEYRVALAGLAKRN